MTSQSIESFVTSWKSAQGDKFSDRMARRSLEALAHEVPEFQAALRELEVPVLETLDLHLTGPRVEGHSTSAAGLSLLYGAIADAAKEIVKSARGTLRGHSNLLALAPSPGSVRIVLQAPAVKYPQSTLGNDLPESPDGQALRSIAQILLSAETKSESLDASARALPRKARIAIGKVGIAVRQNRWDVEGELTARGKETIMVSLTPHGASRLIQAVSDAETETKEVNLTGAVDSWAWSTGAMRFLPRGGKGFSAAVPPRLQSVVARLNGMKAQNVTARFSESRRIPVGTDKSSRTVYLLTDLVSEGVPGITEVPSSIE